MATKIDQSNYASESKCADYPDNSLASIDYERLDGCSNRSDGYYKITFKECNGKEVSR